MSTPLKSVDHFKSTYKARVTLIPAVVMPGVSQTPIELLVSGNKTLPGLADGETWTLSTDDPMQEIAETITGKFGGVSQLSFDVPYDPILLRRLVAHALTNFTVEVIYNDTALDHIYAINVFNCFLVNPGNTSGTANSSAPTMTVTLQPRGGGLLADCMSVERTTRTAA